MFFFFIFEQEEEWRPIKRYFGLYWVSNIGRVKCVSHCFKNSKGNKCTLNERYLKCHKVGKGYLAFDLSDEQGNVKTNYAHRLVAEAFIPNPHEFPQVNHIDEDKTNNSVDNLEWCTISHNVNWGTANERRRIGRVRPLLAIRINDGKLLKFNSYRDAELHGYKPNHISDKNRTILYRGKQYHILVWFWEGDEIVMPKIIKKNKSVRGISIIDNNIIEYDTLNIANKDGYCPWSINKAIKNKTIYKNYIWEYM